MKKNRFYLTTSIAYINAPPHIGFALESLQADVVARFHREKGEEVFFLTGTDEHGVKIARAAENEGEKPKDFADRISTHFKDLKTILNLSWDNFIRTSDHKMHWPTVHEIWKKIFEAGDFYKKAYKGLYCVGHEAFVTKKDLVNGECAIHKRIPEEVEEENWFFKLSKYGDEIKKRIESDELKIIPESRKNEVLSFLEDGLEDISFSRPLKSLSWGIPVPGDSEQTIYVWADALSNYISGYGGTDEWQKHPADVHFIGKDILRFHAVIWPAMLLSARLSLPKSIFVHGFITVEGEKMSKSLGNIVDPFELVKKYGVDAVRYYLLREISASEDGDFSYLKFEDRYNGDLANGLGNFTARVLTLGSQLEKINLDISIEKMIADKIESIKETVTEKIRDFKFNEALASIWELMQLGDQYLNDKKPWDKSKEAKNKETVIYNALMILKNIAGLLRPFLPETADKINECFKETADNFLEIKGGEMLYPRLRQ